MNVSILRITLAGQSLFDVASGASVFALGETHYPKRGPRVSIPFPSPYKFQ